MFKYILQSGGNFNWMAIFALLTFIIVFALSIYLIFKKDEGEMDRMSNMPLQDDFFDNDANQNNL